VLQPIVNNKKLFSFSNSIVGQVILNYNNVLDFESETNSKFNLQIKATDSGSPSLSTEADLIVRTLDVNEAPKWSIVPNFVLDTIEENSAAGLKVGQSLDSMVIDSDIHSTLVLSLVSAFACDNTLISIECNSGGDEGIVVLDWFSLDEKSGQLTLTENAKIDFELLPKLRLTVKATDNGIGNLYSSISFFVLVKDMPEYPQFVPLTTPMSMVDILANEYLTFSVDEHIPIGTVVVSSTTLAGFVHDYDVGDTFTFCQVFGAESDSEPVSDLTDLVTWSDTSLLTTTPFWLAKEGSLHGWFTSSVPTVDATVLVPFGSTSVHISLRYWSVGMWDSNDNEEAQVLVNGVNLWRKRRSSAVTCDGWSDIEEMGPSAGCFYDVEVAVPVSLESPWQCLSGVKVPLRVNIYGDVECYSQNDRHCMWGTCDTSKIAEAITHSSTSLSCGAEHLTKHGMTGYAESNHWCYKGRSAMKQGKSMKVSIRGTVNSVSGLSKWGFSRFSIVSGGDNIASVQPVFKVTSSGNIISRKPLYFNDASSRTLSIEVRDSAGLSTRAIVTIKINDINQAPLFSSNKYFFSIPENSIGGIAAVSESDVIQAFDDDENQALTYSIDISKTPISASLFEVMTTSVDGETIAAIVSKNNVDLDYESQNNYTMALIVTDSIGASSTATVSIYISDVNEPPLPATEEVSYWVRGGTNQVTVGSAITANDPDADDEHDITIVSWKKCISNCNSLPAFTGMALDAIPFAVDESKFTLFVPSYINAAVEIANGNRFQVVVTIEDSFGYLKTVTADIQVTFNNNAPVAVDQSIRVPENTDSYTVVGAISAADLDSTQVLSCNVTGSSPSIAQQIFLLQDRYMTNTQTTNTAGTVHRTDVVVGDLTAMNRTIDFEEISNYELQVAFFDDYTQPLYASATIIFTIIDVNEPPEVDASNTLFIPENSANAKIGGPINVKDPEGQQMAFSIINPNSVPFIIDTGTGQLSTNSLTTAPLLNFEYISYYDVVVQIVDTAGSHTKLTTVRVMLTDVNEAPTISTASLTTLPSAISESTSEGTIIGMVSAADVDADTTLSMSVSSSPIDGIFSISRIGEIKIENAANLDYEAIATVASTFSFPSTTNSNLNGPFSVGTNGCIGYLECQFVSLTEASNFCQRLPECNGVVHDLANTRTNCERGLGCFYPRSESTKTTSFGKTSYIKTHISDPLATLSVTVTASDSLLQDVETFNIKIKDANDIYVSAASNLDPELYDAESGDEAQFSTFGGEFVYLYGFNFGPVSPSRTTPVTARYGVNSEYNAIDCTVFFSNTVIRCKTVPGVGRGHPWSITVGSYTANQVTATISYSAPTITGAPSVNSLYSSGIQGRCLDSNNRTPPSETFSVGSDNACRQLCTLCSVRSTCTACLSYDWNVRSKKCRLYQNVLTSANGKPRRRCYYKLPTTSSLAFRTVGGDPFVLTGTNFGPLGTKVNVFYGPSTNPLMFAALKCAVAVPHTKISCVSAPGVGSNLAATVSIFGQTAQTSSGLFSYGKPIVEDVVSAPKDGSSNLIETELRPPQNIPTTGGTLIDITGMNFPPLDAGVNVQSILHVTYGPTGSDFNAVNCRVVQSGMIIRCEMAPGYGKDHYWRVSVDGLVSSMSPVKTSYQLPSITSCYGPACLKGSTAGGQLLVLTGKNLNGPIEYVTYGKTGVEYRANSCQQMTDHLVIACLTAPGTGNNHKWIVRIGEQTSKTSDSLTGYAAPALNTITGDGSSDASTLGGQNIRISGTNFPPYGRTLANSNTIVTYTNGFQTFVAKNCALMYESKFASQAFINCQTVASTGSNLQWNVIVDGQISKPPTTSTAPPTITSIVDYAPNTSTTEGGTQFSLIGTEFGPVGLSSPSITVTYGPTAREYEAVGCRVTKVGSGNSTISCASAVGSGKDMPIIVTVTGQQSDIYRSISSGVLFSYAPPKLIAISESVVNTGSAREIQLFGNNFGEPGSNASVTFGGGKVNALRRVSHVEIRFVVPDWQTGNHNPIVVTVKEQVSNAMYVDFNPPSIFNIGQSTEFTSVYAGTTIFIEGVSFGASSSTGRVLIDGLPCVINTWSHTRIECETLDLDGELKVIAGEQVSNVVSDFSVQKFLIKPTITSMSITTGDPLGGYLVTLSGTDFADETVSTVTIGNKRCLVNSIYPGSLHQDTIIKCLVPAGEGRVNVTVTVEWQTSDPMTFEYTNPIVDSQEATDHNTLGGAIVTLVGRHLGDASVVFWDGEVSVQTKGTSIGANGSHVSSNATAAFCEKGCMDRKFQDPCTHPSCMSCQWYLSKYCNEDKIGYSNNNELCSDECITAGFSLTASACSVPLLRVVAQCPSQNSNKSDIVVINQTSTKISFIAPPGEGKQHQIQVIQSGNIRSNVALFDYDPPFISSLSPLSSNTNGTGIMTVHGSNFGENPIVKIIMRKSVTFNTSSTLSSRTIITNVVDCKSIPGKQTHESISCLIPEGQGNLHLVYVEAARQKSQNKPFGYNPPVLKSITPEFGDTKGHFNISLTGMNFGLQAKLIVGNRTASILEQNHTYLVAVAPGGIGLNNSVFLNVEGQVSNSLNLAYLPPSIAVISPNPADAYDGELITIEGRNFGADRSNVTVEIDGKPCDNAQWVNFGGNCNTTDNAGKPTCHPVIQCTTPPLQKIGGVSVRVTVAEQEVFVGVDDTPILSLSCPFNMYGSLGEVCRNCPVGALCPGQGKDPLSLAGWWGVNRDTFVKCIPASACIGNNTCAKGYEQDVKYCARCASKTDTNLGYYRVDLSCNQCSALAPFWFTVAILSILSFVSLLWILTTWEFRLASLNILIDFLQVMALCASIKLKWDAAGEGGWALSLIEGSTLFAFNLQGFMPECVFEGWSYEHLWWYLLLTPPIVLTLVWLASLLHLCGDNQRVLRKKSPKLTIGPKVTPGSTKEPSETDRLLSSVEAGEKTANGKHKHKHRRRKRISKKNAFTINAHAWGAFMIIMYYLFAPIVTRVWEPFDCAEFKVGQNRSFFTMEADPTEQCYGSTDSTYWVRLAVFAGLLGILYTFVLPTLLFLTFYRYRHAIEKDLIRSQTHETEGQSWRQDLAVKRLQAQFRGALTRKTHGTKMFFARKTKIHNTTVIRKHYGKLYEDFQPQFYYWRFVLMIRKFFLTITIFLPSSSPVFQATIAIVILFTSFVLQVKFQPYMHRHSHPTSLHTSEEKEKDGAIVGLFGSLLSQKTSVKASEEEKRSLLPNSGHADDNDLAKKRWKKAILVTRSEIRWHHVAKRKAKDVFAWLFDYNSLEQMALSCAIMVLLNGIMLETNSLRSPVLGVLKIAPEGMTKGFVSFIDILTVVMFMIPCILLPFSIFLDVLRNMAFAIHNRNTEKKRREVAVMAARAEAAQKDRVQSQIEKWRSIQKVKLEKNLSILDKDHLAIMKAAKINYEEDRLDCEEDLKRILTERLRYAELQALLRSKTPANAVEAEKLNMDLKKINQAKSAMDDQLLQLQDEMQALDHEYREKSSKRQSDYAQKRAEMNLMFQEALRRKISGSKSDVKSKLKGTMPVQLQMKVLVSQRQFDDKMKRIILVKEQMTQLEKSLGKDSAGELMERNKLDDELLGLEDAMSEKHDEIQLSKEGKLSDLELQKQDLFGQQKDHSKKMHQIDMAAEAHRRALEKELSPAQVLFLLFRFSRQFLY
jgi:hypothetical protein